MKVKEYIDATYSLVEGGMDDASVLSRLKAYLEKRGLTKLYPLVLRGLIEKIRRKTKTSRAKVVLAREEDGSRYKGDIMKACAQLGVTEYDVVIDDTLIGGFIVKGKNERLDLSFKQRLLHTYQNVTD
jgi:F0F1-type ATP synthase delta subunit